MKQNIPLKRQRSLTFISIFLMGTFFSCDNKSNNSSSSPTNQSSTDQIIITVVNENNTPVSGANVTLYPPVLSASWSQETNPSFNGTTDNAGKISIKGQVYNSVTVFGCYIDCKSGTRSNWEASNIKYSGTVFNGTINVTMVIKENKSFFLSKANGGTGDNNGKKWANSSFKANGVEQVGLAGSIYSCYLDDVYYFSKPTPGLTNTAYISEGNTSCNISGYNNYSQSGTWSFPGTNQLSMLKTGIVTINSLTSSNMVIQYSINGVTIIQTLTATV